MKIENEKLLAKVAEIIGAGDKSYGEEGLSIHAHGDSVTITHAQMYNYLKVNFETMEKLSKVFGSKKIHVDPSYHHDGCETCDYGSRYYTEVRVEKVDLSQWI